MSLVKTAIPSGMYEIYTLNRWIIARHPKWKKNSAIVMHKCRIWSLRYEIVLNEFIPNQGGTCLRCKKRAPEGILTVNILYNDVNYIPDKLC